MPSREISVISTCRTPSSRPTQWPAASVRPLPSRQPRIFTSPPSTSRAAMTRAAPNRSTAARTAPASAKSIVPTTTAAAPASEIALDGRQVADSAADLHRHDLRKPGDESQEIVVTAAVPRRREIDQVQPRRPGPAVAFGDFERVVAENRNSRKVSLCKSDDFSVQYVDGRDYLHSGPFTHCVRSVAATVAFRSAKAAPLSRSERRQLRHIAWQTTATGDCPFRPIFPGAIGRRRSFAVGRPHRNSMPWRTVIVTSRGSSGRQ